MGIAVLGPLEVEGRTKGLSPRDRVVLSALVVGRGDPVSADALADALWGNDLPASWVKIVQGCVVRLRKLLGAAAIDSGPWGYRLNLTGEEVDYQRFERLLDVARDALGDDPERASHLVREALHLWRGRALADLEEWEPGRVEAARLEELRMDAEELLVTAEMGAGRAQATLERARTLVAQAPLRERRWVLLATLLYQCGRQADALSTATRARATLAEELGLDPGRELADLEALLLHQDPSLGPPPHARTISPFCPYRGLLPYGADDTDFFFGREADAAACLRRLRDTHVLAVVGPSGIGKSSLVLAGVAAALTRAGTAVLVTTPGAHPLDSLADLKPRGRQTLVVDQAEEVLTLCADVAERERYVSALAAHVGAGGALVLSLRVDHLGGFAPYPDIVRVVEDGLYLLGPMGEADLRSAVEGPARRSGLRLEPGLVDLLVREVRDEPAALPLLSHVLRETWERREGPTLTVAGYRTSGGIQHAVAQSAEALYETMDDAQRSRLRSLLLRLVRLDEAGDAVPARVPRAKVATDEAHVRMVEQLVHARLLSIDRDTVQIAHEALVRVWPRLRGWLDDDVEGQRLFRHLAGAADTWDAMGRPDSELYRGTRLARTLEWRDRERPALSLAEAAFLRASAAESESELRAAQERILRERRINRRLRGAMTGVTVLAAFALLAGVLAIRSSDQAEGDRDRARTAADLAQARRAAAAALVHEDPSTSLLLALSALQVDTSAQAWDNVAAVLMRSPSLLALRDPGGFVVDLTASPDGAFLAVSRPEENAGLLLLDAATLEPLPFNDDIPASGIAFSPDSSLLAMAVNHWTGNQGSQPRIDAQPVRLYDMPHGTLADRQLGGLPKGSSVEYGLDFSADGRRLVAAVDHYDAATGRFDADTTATVWHLDDPSRPVFRIKVPEYPILKLSPDGKRLYVVGKGGNKERQIRVYDVDAGQLIDSTQSASLGAFGDLAGALSPDGSTLAVATGSTVLRVDTQTLQFAPASLQSDTGDAMDRLEYSHDGSQLAAATGTGQVLVWDTKTGAPLHRFVEGGPSWGLDFSADDQKLYSAGGYVTAWDLTGQRELFSVGKASDLADYTVSHPGPDGRTVVRERLGQMWFVDNQTGRETAKRPTPTPDAYRVWSPDARWLLAWRDGDTLRLFETATGRLVAQRQLSGAVVPAFSPSSDRVYVNDIDENLLLVLDRATLRGTRAPIKLPTRVFGIVPHPHDGSVFAIANDGQVLRLEPNTGAAAPVASPGTFPPGTVDADLSDDGTRLLGPNLNPNDVQVQLVDATTWQRFGTAAPRNERFGTFDLSPDGTQFAAQDGDAIALFDGITGARQATLPLPLRPPEARLTYLPDSRGLLVAGIDGRTWTVDTRLDSWSDRACTISGRNLSREEWKQYFPGRDYEITCPHWPAGS